MDLPPRRKGQTTRRYTHLEVEDLQAQVADLPANRLPGAS
jgi:hypothetical protein